MWLVLAGLWAVHVVPKDDLIQHCTQDCPCGPRLDRSGMLVHASLDGRELSEVDHQ
jgi:hypothetical protein